MYGKQQPDLAPELDADEVVELKHKVWTALDCIQDGTFNIAEALEAYNISQIQLETYRFGWNKVQK